MKFFFLSFFLLSFPSLVLYPSKCGRNTYLTYHLTFFNIYPKRKKISNAFVPSRIMNLNETPDKLSALSYWTFKILGKIYVAFSYSTNSLCNPSLSIYTYYIYMYIYIHVHVNKRVLTFSKTKASSRESRFACYAKTDLLRLNRRTTALHARESTELPTPMYRTSVRTHQGNSQVYSNGVGCVKFRERILARSS